MGELWGQHHMLSLLKSRIMCDSFQKSFVMCYDSPQKLRYALWLPQKTALCGMAPLGYFHSFSDVRDLRSRGMPANIPKSA